MVVAKLYYLLPVLFLLPLKWENLHVSHCYALAVITSSCTAVFEMVVFIIGMQPW